MQGKLGMEPRAQKGTLGKLSTNWATPIAICFCDRVSLCLNPRLSCTYVHVHPVSTFIAGSEIPAATGRQTGCGVSANTTPKCQGTLFPYRPGCQTLGQWRASGGAHLPPLCTSPHFPMSWVENLFRIPSLLPATKNQRLVLGPELSEPVMLLSVFLWC